MATDLDVVGQAERGVLEYVKQRERGITPGIKRGETTAPGEYLGGGREVTRASKDVELERDTPKRTKEQPLSHWSEHIQRQFEKLPEKTQRAWLDSFKIVEKGYIKNLNALKADIETASRVLSTIEPYYEEIYALGMSPQDYIKHLIEFDNAMGKNPAKEVAKLILQHNIHYEDVYPNLVKAEKEAKEQIAISKYVDPLKKEVEALKSELYGTPETTEEEAIQQADLLFEQLKNYFNQTDENGQLLYPGAFDVLEDIIELVQAGESLDDAYDLVMSGERLSDSDEDDSKEEPYEKEIDYTPRDTERRDKRHDERDYLNSVMRHMGM